ncbi:MAG: hypothetical protein JXL97_11180 [Bacteroidales bacterium]|nr:hypothetical protein [Bacteroidales bacterium]
MTDYKVNKLDYIFSKDCNCKSILEKQLQRPKEQIIDDLIEAGLKGRGGAGFLTGLKWKFALAQQDETKYVICNADEGEPGTFKDRKILTEVPCKVFSGMTLCANVIGATKGYIYLRAEYNYMKAKLEDEIKTFTEDVLKPFKIDFSIEIFSGSGAYVCGEETALIESMEGKRGEPRNKPPFPISNGYLGKPTVVNNVETFASAVTVMRLGAEAYKNLGTSDQHGSKLLSISGDTPIPGVYEIELGMRLSDFAKEFGDGDTKAIQVGGVAGFSVPRKEFESTIIGEGQTTGGAIMIFNSSRSMYKVLHNFLEFYEEESCGQCTPCRVGCQQLKKGIEAVKSGEKSPEYLEQLVKLTDTMKFTAKCGLGQSVGNSFKSIVQNFREELIY